MKRWSYFCLEVDKRTTFTEGLIGIVGSLNELGAEGWEAFYVERTPRGQQILLKRPVLPEERENE